MKQGHIRQSKTENSLQNTILTKTYSRYAGYISGRKKIIRRKSESKDIGTHTHTHTHTHTQLNLNKNKMNEIVSHHGV